MGGRSGQADDEQNRDRKNGHSDGFHDRTSADFDWLPGETAPAWKERRNELQDRYPRRKPPRLRQFASLRRKVRCPVTRTMRFDWRDARRFGGSGRSCANDEAIGCGSDVIERIAGD